jgi:hypothetical protein
MNNNLSEWKVFICHATEDKGDIANQFANDLEKLGLNVFYDDKSILFGDNIDYEVMISGLLNTRYAIIIFSKKFYKKLYPQYELGVIMFLSFLKHDIIPIPVIYDIKEEIVKRKSPYFYKNKGIIIDKNKDLGLYIKEAYNHIKVHEKSFIEKADREKEKQHLSEELNAEKERINDLHKKIKIIKYILIATAIIATVAMATSLIPVLNRDKSNSTQNDSGLVINDTTSRIISGKIEDMYDNPIKNAKVEIAETINNSSFTDNNGTYVLKVKPDLPKIITLKVSHPEYLPVEYQYSFEIPAREKEFYIKKIVLTKITTESSPSNKETESTIHINGNIQSFINASKDFKVENNIIQDSSPKINKE